ncbi:4Fe-4S binding protein [Anaerovorax odorimutans]|uniref:4Fe-4S binding protein n=1 Tax=Anaerovorax odorimutans TaxID=109327 RepID=UPI00040107FB|nr:4Fe-4S binding protein [Anaerovorax odorimutans]
MKNNLVKNKWRWIISIFFLIFAMFAAIMHQIKGGGPSGSASVDALCPFGGLETLFSLIKDGSYISKITPSSVVLLIAVLILAVLFGKVFCGYICPLGTIQSLFNKLAKKLKIKQLKPNKHVDKILRYSKYVVLFVVLFITYKAGELILRPLDPWASFMHLGSGLEVFEEFLIGVIILALIIISSLFIERAWCRYFCPLGAALAIISPIRIFKIKRNSSSCTGCMECTKNCPMGLSVHSDDSPSSMECISCGECISSCPVEKTLETKRGRLAVSPGKTATILVIFLVLFIGANIFTGNFKTSLSNKAVLTESEVLDPENIKGYMTINDVCEEFNIEPSILLEYCGLPEDTELDIPVKDLKESLKEEGIDFETDNLREVVEEINNLDNNI